MAGLVMRCWPRFRTLPGIAALGLMVLGITRGEQAVGIYAISFATFVYVRLAQQVAAPKTRLSRLQLATIGMVALAVAFFSLAAVRDLAHAEHREESFVGLLLDMYLYLRLVSYLWEFGVERLQNPAFIPYLAWCGLPFTASEPVLRCSEFQRQIPLSPASLPRIDFDWWRSVFVRLSMLAAAHGFAEATTILEKAGPLGRLLTLYGTAPWSFYLEAAASAALLRSAAILGGLEIPINYKNPFVSRSISEFWTRWNITATNVFRDILFFNRWGLDAPNLYLNSMIVFCTVGLWHGVNDYWLIWGLLQGLGFCVFIAWRKRVAMLVGTLPAAISWAITYTFVCSCWAIPPQLMQFGRFVVRRLAAD